MHTCIDRHACIDRRPLPWELRSGQAHRFFEPPGPSDEAIFTLDELIRLLGWRQSREWLRQKFRYRNWAPALRAAGIEHRRVYDCWHTFASWAIAGDVQLFSLARIMGTSVAQIDQS